MEEGEENPEDTGSLLTNRSVARGEASTQMEEEVTKEKLSPVFLEEMHERFQAPPRTLRLQETAGIDVHLPERTESGGIMETLYDGARATLCNVEEEVLIIFREMPEQRAQLLGREGKKVEDAHARNDDGRQKRRRAAGGDEVHARWRLLEDLEEGVGRFAVQALERADEAAQSSGFRLLIQPLLQIPHVINADRIRFHTVFGTHLLRNIGGTRDDVPVRADPLNPELIENEEIRMDVPLQEMQGVQLALFRLVLREEEGGEPLCNRELSQMLPAAEKISVEEIPRAEIPLKLSTLSLMTDERGGEFHGSPLLAVGDDPHEAGALHRSPQHFLML